MKAATMIEARAGELMKTAISMPAFDARIDCILGQRGWSWDIVDWARRSVTQHALRLHTYLHDGKSCTVGTRAAWRMQKDA
jgi:hypothetical protein